jgi:hypothetical protein
MRHADDLMSESSEAVASKSTSQDPEEPPSGRRCLSLTSARHQTQPSWGKVPLQYWKRMFVFIANEVDVVAGALRCDHAPRVTEYF